LKRPNISFLTLCQAKNETDDDNKIASVLLAISGWLLKASSEGAEFDTSDESRPANEEHYVVVDDGQRKASTQHIFEQHSKFKELGFHALKQTFQSLKRSCDSEVGTMQEQLDPLQANNKTLNKNLKDRTSENQRLKLQVENMKRKWEVATEARKDLEQQYYTDKKHFNESVEWFNLEVGRLEKQLVFNDRELRAANSLSRYTEMLNDIAASKGGKGSAIDSISSEKIEALQAEIEALEEKTKGLEQERNEVTARLEEIKETLEREYEGQISRSESKLKALNAQLQARSNDISGKCSVIETLETEKESLATELAVVKQRLTSVDEQDQEIKHLRSEMARRDSKIQKIEEAADTIIQKYEKMVMSETKWKEECEKMTDNYKDLVATLEERDGEIERLEQKAAADADTLIQVRQEHEEFIMLQQVQFTKKLEEFEQSAKLGPSSMPKESINLPLLAEQSTQTDAQPQSEQKPLADLSRDDVDGLKERIQILEAKLVSQEAECARLQAQDESACQQTNTSREQLCLAQEEANACMPGMQAQLTELPAVSRNATLTPRAPPEGAKVTEKEFVVVADYHSHMLKSWNRVLEAKVETESEWAKGLQHKAAQLAEEKKEQAESLRNMQGKITKMQAKMEDEVNRSMEMVQRSASLYESSRRKVAVCWQLIDRSEKLMRETLESPADQEVSVSEAVVESLNANSRSIARTCRVPKWGQRSSTG
jgi:chromosome segregation ATPase